MLTPNGFSGDNCDPVMLMNIWAKKVAEIYDDLILAHMGRPTAPANQDAIKYLSEHWTDLDKKITLAEDNPEMITESLAVDYGHPQGEPEARELMAAAMTKWYEEEVNPDNILFTVGGAGGLRIIFNTFNKLFGTHYRILTPFPHYTFYANNSHMLHPINVMTQPGYRLTAKILQDSIELAQQLAKKDNCPPKAVLFCNPSNPLGTVMSRKEMEEIVKVLKKFPGLMIIIDEAYAELYWGNEKIPSFLEYAKELKSRMIILRSGTKGLSLAGERLAVLMAFDPELMNSLRNTNISTIGHAPLAAQFAFAHAWSKFEGGEGQQKLKKHYQPKVEYVFKRAKEMGASMPDPNYKIEGAFYVLCDLSELLGEKIPLAAEKALGKSGTIKNSEDLVYSLMHEAHLLVAPGCYFGLPKNNGIVRITCSNDEVTLKKMMDTLEACLLAARKNQAEKLKGKINRQLLCLTENNNNVAKSFTDRLNILTKNTENSLELKIQNKSLSALETEIKRVNPHIVNQAAHIVLNFFKTSHRKIQEEKKQQIVNAQWIKFVEQICTEDSVKKILLEFTNEQREALVPWQSYIQKLEFLTEQSNNPKLH